MLMGLLTRKKARLTSVGCRKKKLRRLLERRNRKKRRVLLRLRRTITVTMAKLRLIMATEMEQKLKQEQEERLKTGHRRGQIQKQRRGQRLRHSLIHSLIPQMIVLRKSLIVKDRMKIKQRQIMKKLVAIMVIKKQQISQQKPTLTPTQLILKQTRQLNQ